MKTNFEKKSLKKKFEKKLKKKFEKKIEKKFKKKKTKKIEKKKYLTKRKKSFKKNKFTCQNNFPNKGGGGGVKKKNKKKRNRRTDRQLPLYINHAAIMSQISISHRIINSIINFPQ